MESSLPLSLIDLQKGKTVLIPVNGFFLIRMLSCVVKLDFYSCLGYSPKDQILSRMILPFYKNFF